MSCGNKNCLYYRFCTENKEFGVGFKSLEEFLQEHWKTIGIAAANLQNTRIRKGEDLRPGEASSISRFIELIQAQQQENGYNTCYRFSAGIFLELLYEWQRPKRLKYVYGQEFFRDAIPSDIQKEVVDKIRQEKVGQLIDPEKLRRTQDWNELADKPVGM